MSEKVFGCLYERTEKKKNIAVNCLNDLRKRLVKEGRADLINVIDYSLQEIKEV